MLLDASYDALDAAFEERRLDALTEECGHCGAWPVPLSLVTLLCEDCEANRYALLASLIAERFTSAPSTVLRADAPGLSDDDLIRARRRKALLIAVAGFAGVEDRHVCQLLRPEHCPACRAEQSHWVA